MGVLGDYTYDKLQRLTDVVQTGQAGGNAVVAKHIMQAFNASNQRTNITRYQSSGTANLVASTNFTFDTVGRLDGIQHLRQGAINLNSYSYTYDGMSRLSNVTSTAEGTATFSYDSSSQLESAIGTQPAESYAYDDNGNRNMTGYVTATDNRTTSDPNFNYQYDAEGNLIRKTSKTNSQDDTLYQYDHRNRLTRVQFGPIPGANNYVTYEYDGFDRLVRRFLVAPPTYVSEATYWIYDEGINPVLELTNNFSGNGYVTHRYLWSNSVDDLLADEQVNPSNNTANTLYPLSDHLGSIRDIADFDEATGITAIANHRRYNSFGKLMQETGTADIAFGYTGKLYDKKTGLQNNWNRWYDSNLGRWISQDPIGLGPDTNMYRYVGNSPTNLTDPSGLEPPGGPRPSTSGVPIPPNPVPANPSGVPDPLDEPFPVNGKDSTAPAYKLQTMYGGKLTRRDFQNIDKAIDRVAELSRNLYNFGSPPSGVSGMQCYQYSEAIAKDRLVRDDLRQAGFEILDGDVYSGHKGVYIYRPSDDGRVPKEFWLIHVGSGMNPLHHTQWGRLWPVKISFPDDWLMSVSGPIGIIPLCKQNNWVDTTPRDGSQDLHETRPNDGN